jgi:hypothetical protein
MASDVGALDDRDRELAADVVACMDVIIGHVVGVYSTADARAMIRELSPPIRRSIEALAAPQRERTTTAS